ADAAEIELAFDIRRFGDANPRLVFPGLRRHLFVEHLLAQHHAVVADINTRTGNQLLHFGVRFAAEAAQGDIRRPRHAYSFLSARLVARSTRPGISLRDWTTSSTNP